MKLSRDEELYLRHWMHEELCYRDGPGPAKPASGTRRGLSDLAAIIAAALPVPADQQAAAQTPPNEAPRWPWSAQSLAERLQAAHRLLAERAADGAGRVPQAPPTAAVVG